MENREMWQLYSRGCPCNPHEKEGDIKKRWLRKLFGCFSITTFTFSELIYICSLPREEVIKKLLTYTTFFITRHPFERLISAYQSKFSGEYASQGKEIALRQAAEHLPGLSYSIKR